MKHQLIPVFVLLVLISSCSNRASKAIAPTPGDSAAKNSSIQPLTGKTNTDTLQLIHFDGNTDYWYAYFLTTKKDTLRLVTDQQFTEQQLNKLFEATWKEDTLSEAGDDDKKYPDNRLLRFKPIKGLPFVRPVAEQQVLNDIKSLVEVKENADRVWIGKKPDFEKPYFEVETATVGEDNNSRLFSFRVYVYPHYEIKVLDPADEMEQSLAEWRKKINN